MKHIGGLFFIILLAFAGSMLQAQTNITIRGEVVDGAGKEVYLYRYTDMLTRTEMEVDHTTVGSNRVFELHAFANYPTMMVLQIENYSQSFFVEPGREYEVYVPRFDWNIDEKKNIFLSPEVLPLEFVNMPADELNGLISNFEAVVADYIDNHRVYFDGRFRPQKRYFDSLEIEVRKKAPDTRNEFYNRYKRYQLASMKYSFHFDTRRNMANRFVKGQPILYYDDNYMSFFFTLFANSVSKGTTKIPVWRMGQWVNDLKLDLYLDSIGTDTLLHNEQVRELVALEALQESYYLNRYYESDKVLKMIDLLGSRTKFPEHKTLARQLAASLLADFLARERMLGVRRLEHDKRLVGRSLRHDNPVFLNDFVHFVVAEEHVRAKIQRPAKTVSASWRLWRISRTVCIAATRMWSLLPSVATASSRQCTTS